MQRPPCSVRLPTYRRTRWKNGGGETMGIAISPTGTSPDNLEWRLSMAIVSSDGPLSIFAGVDRTLRILDGAGIDLKLNDDPARRLDETSPPVSFFGWPSRVATAGRR
jgi:environmental stress-induced protein Ves